MFQDIDKPKTLFANKGSWAAEKLVARRVAARRVADPKRFLN